MFTKREVSLFKTCQACVLASAAIYVSLVQASATNRVAELGRYLFNDAALSADGSTSCSSCHAPDHAYADPHARSIGVEGRIGTRNAPSLVGIAEDAEFFWDGRRTRLEDAVLDPFTNPMEFGLNSVDEALSEIRQEPSLRARFKMAFPGDSVIATREQLQLALASFVRSLKADRSRYDASQRGGPELATEAEYGRRLFVGVAGCADCHTVNGAAPRLSDGRCHHSGIGGATHLEGLPALAKAVAGETFDASNVGPKVLADPDWSSLGRFVVTHDPAEIGAFRTPSLRNAELTAPYMHDGSILTLSAAVDHEIYYHGARSDHVVELTASDRQAIVEFLTTLTDH